MIEKIQDWLFFKYSIQVETKHIWMFLILVGSIMLLLVTLIINGGSDKKVDPKSMPILPGMSGGVPSRQMSSPGAAPGVMQAVPQAPIAR
ncbi:MAG: hypothetical protein NTY33_02310 [Candidatus Moranbacteria bacterium]|nr:hypothetical protein [Candidatus Moranbacteria bacterium]